MTDLRSLTLDELSALLQNTYGEKKFRAVQIYEWLHKKLATGFDEMTNIPKELRVRLARECTVSVAAIKEKHVSRDRATKYLFELEKNTIIESVLMKHAYGNSVCVSSQAGCRMGCAFCASTTGGLARNLTAGEIAAQVYGIQKDSPASERVSRVVVMGSGEPFDNYSNLIRFLKIITSKEGLCIGARHITVSTCGLTDRILDFAAEGMQVNLAVSLHAPDDALRKQLMPVAKKYNLDELFAACARYAEITGRRVTYEYALIAGVNDLPACARELGRRLKGTLSHVNLIPFNPVPGSAFKPSDRKTVAAFAATLAGFGVAATVRRRLGGDVEGACGQLRWQYISDGKGSDDSCGQ